MSDGPEQPSSGRLPEILRGRLALPVICAPMFIVSGPELVIAQCLSGVVGSFPALNARPAELLLVTVVVVAAASGRRKGSTFYNLGSFSSAF